MTEQPNSEQEEQRWGVSFHKFVSLRCHGGLVVMAISEAEAKQKTFKEVNYLNLPITTLVIAKKL